MGSAMGEARRKITTLPPSPLVPGCLTCVLLLSLSPSLPLSLSLCTSVPKALKIVQITSLPILEGEALGLLCVVDSNTPVALSQFWSSPVLNVSPSPRPQSPAPRSWNCLVWRLWKRDSIPARLSTRWAPGMFPSASLCRVSCRISTGGGQPSQVLWCEQTEIWDHNFTSSPLPQEAPLPAGV